MSNTIQFVICGLVLTTVAALSSNLPKGFVQCKKSDPKFNECLRDGLNSAVPQLANGIPSFKLTKLDPLRIVELKIDQDSSHPVNINLKFNDIDILNLKYIDVNKFQYDPVSHNATINLLIPNSLIIQGNYEINGKVLVVPITGKGKCKLVMDVSKLDLNIQFKPKVKNGNTYLKADAIKLNFVASKLQVQLNNLFNGDKALGDNMNLFLNDNWPDVLKEIQPAIEEAFSAVLMDSMQHFFDRIPENELYLA